MVGMMILFQANCATLQFSPSFAPDGDGGDPTNSASDDSGGSSTGNIVGIATIAVVGGYLVYRAISGDPDEEEDSSPPETAPQPKRDLPISGPEPAGAM
jgi:hypothetical protein